MLYSFLLKFATPDSLGPFLSLRNYLLGPLNQVKLWVERLQGEKEYRFMKNFYNDAVAYLASIVLDLKPGTEVTKTYTAASTHASAISAKAYFGKNVYQPNS